MGRPHCDLSRPHILFSLSKLMTAMLAGILVECGGIAVGRTALHYLPQCKNRADETSTVQQILEMTVAFDIEEFYAQVDGDYRRYRD